MFCRVLNDKFRDGLVEETLYTEITHLSGLCCLVKDIEGPQDIRIYFRNRVKKTASYVLTPHCKKNTKPALSKFPKEINT